MIKYAVIGPEQVTITPPTDAEIQAVYNNTPRYQAGRIRTLESIIFGSRTAEADATAFAAAGARRHLLRSRPRRRRDGATPMSAARTRPSSNSPAW